MDTNRKNTSCQRDLVAQKIKTQYTPVLGNLYEVATGNDYKVHLCCFAVKSINSL